MYLHIILIGYVKLKSLILKGDFKVPERSIRDSVPVIFYFFTHYSKITDLHNKLKKFSVLTFYL